MEQSKQKALKYLLDLLGQLARALDDLGFHTESEELKKIRQHLQEAAS